MLNLGRWIFLYLVTAVVDVVAAQLAPPPRGDSNGIYPHFDPSMVILVMVLVCAFFFVGFLSIYIRHCSESNAIAAPAAAIAASASQRSGQKGLDPMVMESFPVFVYSYVKDLKIGKGALECAVCLSEFEDDETLRLIPKCSHVFHLDCIDAWLAYHVTCPVCRAKLTPDSDGKPVESSSNNSGLNSNNNNESSNPPTARPTTTSHQILTQPVEERNEFVIQVNEESQPRVKITGKFPRSHSTGHSLIQPGENIERFTLRLPEEIKKQIAKRGKLKRTRSYDVVLGMGKEGSSRRGGEGSSRRGGEGSSKGKNYTTDRWVFSSTPPFISKMGSLKSPKGGAGGGDGSNSSWRGLTITSVKGKLTCLNSKVEKEESSSTLSPV